MDNFLIAVNAVLPMFLMLLIGFAVHRINIIKEEHLPALNKIVFNVFFPFLMFNNVYGSDFSAAFNPLLLGFAVVAVLVVYFSSLGFTLLVEKNNKSRGAMIQAMYRSNFVLMGMPIVSNIFGSESLGMTAMLVAVIVPMYNILAVITLEVFRGNKVHIGKIFLGIAKNPLILSSLAGVLAVVCGLKIPQTIENTISDMAAVATPLALLVLGASFKFESIKRCRRNLVICVFVRLVAVPALCLGSGAVLGIRGVDFVSLIGLFGAPCAISSYTMSRQMESDYELSAGTVVFTSILSCFTLFLWIFVFKQLNFF